MIEIAQECNVDCAPQRIAIKKAQTHISLIGHRGCMYAFAMALYSTCYPLASHLCHRPRVQPKQTVDSLWPQKKRQELFLFHSSTIVLSMGNTPIYLTCPSAGSRGSIEDPHASPMTTRVTWNPNTTWQMKWHHWGSYRR
jgi:hypothetical protein